MMACASWEEVASLKVGTELQDTQTSDSIAGKQEEPTRVTETGLHVLQNVRFRQSPRVCNQSPRLLSSGNQSLSTCDAYSINVLSTI